MIDFDGTRKNLAISEIVDLAVTRGRMLALTEEELYEYKQQISTLEDEIKELDGKIAHYFGSSLGGKLERVECKGVGDDNGFFEIKG